MRFTVLATAVLVFCGASKAAAQDTDEVKRLRERIELLETKLKLAEREVQDLKKENEQLRAGGGKLDATSKSAGEGFAVGVKLAGAVQRSWVANGKVAVVGDDVEFEVTKRSGAEFTAEVWVDNRKVGYEIEGTIDGNGIVKFKSTKSLTDATANLVGVHAFTGRFDKGVLTGKTTKKGDASYKGEWKLKAKKD